MRWLMVVARGKAVFPSSSREAPGLGLGCLSLAAVLQRGS